MMNIYNIIHEKLDPLSKFGLANF